MGVSQSSENGSYISTPETQVTPAAVNKVPGNTSSGLNEQQTTDRNPDFHRDMNASKMRGDCRKLAADSYKCLEKGDHETCKPFFEAYKTCRKEEHERVLAENGRKFQ